MKRLLSLVLSLAMMITLISTMAVSSSAETFDKTLITFDNDAERTVVTHTYDYAHWVKEVEGFGTGNSAGLNMPSAKGNSLQIRLTPGWKAYQPTAIKFLIKNSESMGNPILKVGFGATAAAASTYSQGLTITATSEADWASVSLEGLDISEFDYISIGKPSVNATIYVDDITLVCSTSALAEGGYEWNTLEDFESGAPETLTTSAKAVTITASTESATGTVTASTASVMAKTSGWNDQRTSNYLTLTLDTAKTAIADDLRVFAKAEANSVDYFGVVIDDTTYWKYTSDSNRVFTKTWSPYYVLDEVFISAADSSSKTIRPADISKITALKFSFSQNTQYGTNLYIDDVEYGEFKEATPAPVEPEGTTTAAISTDAMASIRLGDVSGIRFYTTFNESQIEGTIVEKGTLIGPSDLIGNYLTIEDKYAENAVAVPYLADTLWDGNEFVGSIVGIQEKNYNRGFTARAYVKLDDGTYLYSEATTTKTVAEIADAYIADENSDYHKDGVLSEATKNLVDAWAAAND